MSESASEPHVNANTESVTPPTVGRNILSPGEWKTLSGTLELSRREAEIVQCLFDDETEAAVAMELGISPHTVHTHLERLYRKLGVASRCAAVVRVFGEYLRLDRSGGLGRPAVRRTEQPPSS